MNLVALLAVVFITTSALADERPMNEMPMYGGQHNPDVEPNTAHSADAAKLGWKYLDQGDDATAIKRFNQAWMFNRKNAEAFWGFGIVMGRRAAGRDAEANLNASIKYIQMANDIDPNNGKIIGDLAFSHALLGKELSSKGTDASEQYTKAESLFREAYRLEPKHPPIVANWAALNVYAGNYPEAKKLLDEAIDLGYKPDPEDVREIWDKVK